MDLFEVEASEFQIYFHVNLMLRHQSLTTMWMAGGGSFVF